MTTRPAVVGFRLALAKTCPAVAEICPDFADICSAVARNLPGCCQKPVMLSPTSVRAIRVPRKSARAALIAWTPAWSRL